MRGEGIVSSDTRHYWFRRFKDGDFDLNDKVRSGAPQKIADEELQHLLDMDSAQTSVELAEQLGVDQSTVSKRLHAMGKILKQGKWVPHELTERAIGCRLSTCLSLLARHQRKSFLWKIVIGDEKWVYFDNPKRKKSYVDKGQPSQQVAKRNIRP